MTHLAPYAGEFRVLSKENYNLGREAELSPVDFALGWDRMADPAVYKQLSIRQSNRWYYWRYENAPPIPVNEISSQSANTHLIPATKAIAKQLAQIDQDNLIYLKGQLVEVESGPVEHRRRFAVRPKRARSACQFVYRLHLCPVGRGARDAARLNFHPTSIRQTPSRDGPDRSRRRA